MRRSLLAGSALVVLIAGMPGARAGIGEVPPSPPPPGPSVLWEPLATAPQVENVGGWREEPLLVSGADAYVNGEYLYQDFVYDSYGANTTDVPLAQPDTVPRSTSTSFGGATGDVVYPTDAVYAHNAADLLEFRLKQEPRGTRFRITLNTMIAPDVAGVAIGFGDPSIEHGSSDWGFGIGSLGVHVDDVLVTWGTGSAWRGGSLPVETSVDTTRNQIDVLVPWGDVTEGVTRFYVAVGLFDAAAKRFKQIGMLPTAHEPGGAHGKNVPPVFNVGFRFDEPVGDDPAETGGRDVGFGHWREHGQAKALAARDISRFYADVDFAKLRDGYVESHVPTSGWLNRLYVSRLELGEGARPMRPMLLGKIQPYGVYIPKDAPHFMPLHLQMHSLSCTYNQYAVFTPNLLQQLGQDRGAMVFTPQGRGPDGWYHDEAEYDVFEAMADLMARYPVDSSRLTLGGYSMGGYGTYKFASQYPDLFAKAFSVVGPADENIAGGPTAATVQTENTLPIAANMRHVPLLAWFGANDELVPVSGALVQERILSNLGLRHETDIFPGYDHFLFSVLDEWGPARDFLEDASTVRMPGRVVYRAVPAMDDPALGLVHDHAYWVSNVTVARGAPHGTVDVESLRSSSPVVTVRDDGAGTAPNPHARLAMRWAETPAFGEDTLNVTLRDVTSVTIWAWEAGLSFGRPILVDAVTTFSDQTSSRPAEVIIRSLFDEHRVYLPRGESKHVVTL